MKIKDTSTGLISGKIGNLIYYVMNGKQYARRAAIPGKKRKSEIMGISPAHQAIIKRFSGVQSFYAFFKKYVSAEIWRTASIVEHIRPNNLFSKINSRCFDEQGNLVDFATFYFSRGTLLLPRNIQARNEGNRYRITWQEERTKKFASADDRLCIGVIYDNKPGAPCLLTDVTGKRSDLQGTFTLNRANTDLVHIYCFWAKKDGTAYSNSFYVRLDESV